MFLTVLGGSLALGAGLLAAAGYSEGTLVAARTAALTIGWLFLLAALVGVQGARRGRLAELVTTALVFLSGAGVLYLSYFHWGELPEARVRLAAAEVVPGTDMKLVAAEPLAMGATFVSLPPVAQAEKKSLLDPCSSLPGVEALKCRRCAGKAGIAWMLCEESARLEYCEGRRADEAACPSPIPTSYPG